MATKKRKKEPAQSRPPQRLKARDWNVELRAGVAGTSGQIQASLEKVLAGLRGGGTVATHGEGSVSLKFALKAARVDEALAKAMASFERAFRRAGLPWTPDVISAELQTIEEVDKRQEIAEGKSRDGKEPSSKTR